MRHSPSPVTSRAHRSGSTAVSSSPTPPAPHSLIKRLSLEHRAGGHLQLLFARRVRTMIYDLMLDDIIAFRHVGPDDGYAGGARGAARLSTRGGDGGRGIHAHDEVAGDRRESGTPFAASGSPAVPSSRRRPSSTPPGRRAGHVAALGRLDVTVDPIGGCLFRATLPRSRRTLRDRDRSQQRALSVTTIPVAPAIRIASSSPSQKSDEPIEEHFERRWNSGRKSSSRRCWRDSRS